MRLASEFIAECEAGSPHYMETRTRIDRGRIGIARGDAEGAFLDLERALSVARSISDPQAILPVLSATYAAHEACGRFEEAVPFLTEIVDLVVEYPLEGAITLAFEVAYTKPALEFEPEFREALKRAPPWKWRDVALMSLDGDFVGAANAWAEGGSPTYEARLRLRASEELTETGRLADAQQQAALALDFYRSVGASFFVARAETVLPREQV